MFKQHTLSIFIIGLFALGAAMAIPRPLFPGQGSSTAAEKKELQKGGKKPAKPEKEKKHRRAAREDRQRGRESKAALRTAVEIRESLDGDCGKIFLSETTLEDAKHRIADAIGIPILFDKRTLEEEGIAIDEPNVTIRVANVSWHDLLELILNEQDLTYMIKHRVIMITTVDVACQPENHRFEIYDTSGIFAPASVLSDEIQALVQPDKWERSQGYAILVPLGQNTLMFSGDESLRRGVESCLKKLSKTKIIGAARAYHLYPPGNGGSSGFQGGIL